MLLFLDMHGPLVPFGAPDGTCPVFERAGDTGGHPLLGRVDPRLGAELPPLGCELVWASTWMDDANPVVGPWLGLPVVPWPDEDEPPALIHWTTGSPRSTSPPCRRG